MATKYSRNSSILELDFVGWHVLYFKGDTLKRLQTSYKKQYPNDPEILRAVRLEGVLYISFVALLNRWYKVDEDAD